MKHWLLVLLALTTFAPLAQAQTGRHLGLGAGIGFHHYTDGDFSQKNPGFALVYRIAAKAQPHEGWGFEPKATVDWFKTDVRADVAGVSTHLGKLRSIPVLVGVGPSYRHGRTKVGAAVLAGASFNSFTEDKGVSAISAKNSFAVRPEMGVWYDVSSRLGLHTGVNYLYNRPSADHASGGTSPSAKWKTDHLNFSAGFAIGIF
jgi:hypothetical protein